MAKVNYRGVQYDTEEYRKMLIEEHSNKRNHDLIYRGLKVTKKASVAAQQTILLCIYILEGLLDRPSFFVL